MIKSLSKIGVIYCPFPSKDKAKEVSELLLDRKLIACANILNEGQSLYLWEGEMKSETEIYVLFKTSLSGLESLMSELERLHPYEVPAIVVLETSCNLSYSKWVNQQVEV